MVDREDVTERLKSEDPMEWVRRMDGIRNRVKETIRGDLIISNEY